MNISAKGEACKSGIFQPRAGQRAEAKVDTMGVRRTTKSSRTSPAMIAIAERRAKTLELRRQGHSFEEIGARLGVSDSMRIGTYALAWRRSWPSRRRICCG